MAQRFTNKRRKEKRWSQIDFLVENLTEPQLIPENNNTTLSSVFNVDDDLRGYNPVGITMQFINYRGLNTVDKDNPSLDTLARFMNQIQMYLPHKVRVHSDVQLWWYTLNDDKVTDEASKQKYNELRTWWVNMRHQIENELTNRYMLGGRTQYIEILKRRWRDNWGDSQKIEAETKNQTSGEITYKVVFDDGEG